MVRTAFRNVGLAFGCLFQGVLPGQPSAPTRVIFVCEHGSSKSVVAASHFNRLAQAQGLAIRAVAKGIAPETSLPLPVQTGLIKDGFSPAPFVPERVRPEDFRPDAKVVALGCDLRPAAPEGAAFETWTELPDISDGYPPAREAILARVRRLIESLTARRSP